MKKIRKPLNKAKLMCISLFCLFGFAIFASVVSFSVYPNIYALLNSIDTDSAQKWIRERTFAISITYSHDFVSRSSFGTTWIAKKVSADEQDFRYYLATNMHVISSMLEVVNADKIGSNDQQDYRIRSDAQIALNVPRNPNKILKSNIIGINNDTFRVLIPNEDVSIVKLGFFENKAAYKTNEKLNYNNQQQTANELNSIIKNKQNVVNHFQLPLIDLAVLQFNFKAPHFQQWLKQHYNTSPTSYYKSSANWENAKINNNLINQSQIFIGGFPYSHSKRYSDFQFDTLWKGYFSDGTFIINDYTNNKNKEGPFRFTDNQSNKNIFQNVARNLQLYTVGNRPTTLQSGASGSAAIVYDNEEEKFKVIGIYWGTASATEGINKRIEVLLVDLFYSEEYKAINGDGKFPRYDFLPVLSN